MSNKKINDGFDKSLSRQRRYQLRMKAAGRCQQCGSKELFTTSACEPCVKKRRASSRKRTGSNPWQKGKAGRPPTETQVNEATQNN